MSSRLWHPLLGFSAIGVGLLGIAAHVSGIAPVPYGLGLAIAGAGALFVFRRDRVVESTARPAVGERWAIGFSVLNLVIMNAVLVLSFHVEKRPTFLFYVMTIQAALIAGQVLLAPCSSPITRFLLRLQIVLLQGEIVLSHLLVYPEIGVDIWPQKFFAHEIVVNSHFPLADTTYKGYPFWPALSGVIAMLTGRSEQGAVLIAVPVFSSVALWLVLVGLEHLFGYRNSLIAGLVLCVSNWFIYWASMGVPMIVTVALLCAALVLLFQRRDESWLSLTICLLLVLGAGAFYHPMASIALSLFLVATALVMWTFARRAAGEERSLFSTQARRASGGALVAVVLTLSVWMYLGGTLDHMAQIAYQSIQRLEPLSFRGSYRSTVVYELDYLGFHLILLLAITRFLRWWVKPARSPLEMTLLSGSLVFLGLNYLAIVTDAFFALPHRWLVYASVLLCVPAAVEFGNIARTRVVGAIVSALLVMVLAFNAISNSSINEDNPLYGAEVAFKQSLTASETATVQFLDRDRKAHMAVDWQVWNYFRALEDMDLRPEGSLSQFVMYVETDKGGVCPDHISALPEAALVRQMYVNRRIGWTNCAVDASGLAALDQAREFAKVYDSGESSLYRRVVEKK